MARQARRKVRVPVHRSGSKTTSVEENATHGAQLGIDFYDAEGNVLTLAGLAALVAGTQVIQQSLPPEDADRLFNTIWNRVNEIPDDAYTVLGNPTAGAARPIATKLVAQFFPDDMVTVLSGTEFEIVTDQVDLHAQLRIQIADGITGILIDGDIGDTTTPVIDFMNVGDQQDRRFLYFRETIGNGFFMDLLLSGTFGNNAIVWGSEYSSPGDTPRMMKMWADGRFALANDALTFDPRANNNTLGDDIEMVLTGLGTVRLNLIADTDNSTESDTPAILFSSDGGTTLASIGLSGDANRDATNVAFTGAPANSFSIHLRQGSPTFSVGGSEVALLVDANNDVGIRAGNVFRVYDSTNADSYNFSHNGTNALLTFTGTTVWDVSGAAELELTGGMDLWIRDAGFLRIYDSGDTDYGQLQHDGTNLILSHVNTTAFRIEDVNVVIPDGSLEVGNAAAIIATGPAAVIRRDDTDDALFLAGGDSASLLDGAVISLYGENHATLPGVLGLASGASGWIEVYRTLRILDASGSDYGQFSHDGTDFNFDFVGTTDLNIGGANAVWLVNSNAAGSVSYYVQNTSNNAAAVSQMAIFNDAGNYMYMYKTSSGAGQRSVLGTNGSLEFHTSDTMRMTLLASGLGNYADDSAASGAGVPVGGLYRNGSVVQIRVA